MVTLNIHCRYIFYLVSDHIPSQVVFWALLAVINQTLNLISNNKGYVNKMEMLRIRDL